MRSDTMHLLFVLAPVAAILAAGFARKTSGRGLKIALAAMVALSAPLLSPFKFKGAVANIDVRYWAGKLQGVPAWKETVPFSGIFLTPSEAQNIAITRALIRSRFSTMNGPVGLGRDRVTTHPEGGTFRVFFQGPSPQTAFQLVFPGGINPRPERVVISRISLKLFQGAALSELHPLFLFAGYP
jgi:hypothetical protein